MVIYACQIKAERRNSISSLFTFDWGIGCLYYVITLVSCLLDLLQLLYTHSSPFRSQNHLGKKWTRELPGGPGVRTLYFRCQEPGFIQSLRGELSSQKPCSAAKKRTYLNRTFLSNSPKARTVPSLCWLPGPEGLKMQMHVPVSASLHSPRECALIIFIHISHVIAVTLLILK